MSIDWSKLQRNMCQVIAMLLFLNAHHSPIIGVISFLLVTSFLPVLQDLCRIHGDDDVKQSWDPRKINLQLKENTLIENSCFSFWCWKQGYGDKCSDTRTLSHWQNVGEAFFMLACMAIACVLLPRKFPKNLVENNCTWPYTDLFGRKWGAIQK